MSIIPNTEDKKYLLHFSGEETDYVIDLVLHGKFPTNSEFLELKATVTKHISDSDTHFGQIDAVDATQTADITDLKTRLGSIENEIGGTGSGDSIKIRLERAETNITNLINKDTAIDAEIAALKTKDTNHDTEIANIKVRVTNTENKNTQQDNRLAVLESAVGTSGGGSSLTVRLGNAESNISALQTRCSNIEAVNNTQNANISSLQTSDSRSLKFGTANGQSGLWDRSTAVPTASQQIRYNGYLRATRVLGVYYSDAADYAEGYPIEGNFKNGDIVVLCEDGICRKSTKPYDTHIIGVVSTNPATKIGMEQDDYVPIAMIGRVPVNICNSANIGDFLVTSDTPGMAMAYSSLDNIPRGSVLGMVLSPGQYQVIAVVNRM